MCFREKVKNLGKGGDIVKQENLKTAKFDEVIKGVIDRGVMKGSKVRYWEKLYMLGIGGDNRKIGGSTDRSIL